MTKRQAINKIRNMDTVQLLRQREIISTSIDYHGATKDILIEAIDSRLNRDKLVTVAMVPEADLRLGEV